MFSSHRDSGSPRHLAPELTDSGTILSRPLMTTGNRAAVLVEDIRVALHPHRDALIVHDHVERRLLRLRPGHHGELLARTHPVIGSPRLAPEAEHAAGLVAHVRLRHARTGQQRDRLDKSQLRRDVCLTAVAARTAATRRGRRRRNPRNVSSSAWLCTLSAGVVPGPGALAEGSLTPAVAGFYGISGMARWCASGVCLDVFGQAGCGVLGS